MTTPPPAVLARPMWEPDYRHGYVHIELDERFVMDDNGNAVNVPWYQGAHYFMGEH